MNKLIFLSLLFLSTTSFSQESIHGFVKGKDENGKIIPLLGANIIWLGTTIGTTSDAEGNFRIKTSKESNLLVASYIGYKSDTIKVNEEQAVNFILQPSGTEIQEVKIEGTRSSLVIDYFGVQNSETITTKELYKAACCNLSESFETNPTVDVSFTDAITGAKQIEMLGLAGVYTQTTAENLPYLRGLISSAGLTFIPGTWINAINVSKGVGSVVNGFESITGQIDVDFKKSTAVDEKPVFINLFADYDRRFEGNLNYKFDVNEHLSAITFFHASQRKHKFDINGDGFMDAPTFSNYNVMQKWQYFSHSGLESQFGFQYVDEDKKGGTILNTAGIPSSYSFGKKSNNLNVFIKTGYVFPDDHDKSFGFQISYNKYRSNSHFGLKDYSGTQGNGYFNFIYQSYIVEEISKFKLGGSFIFDEYNEEFLSQTFNRIERIPGAFFEYTFTPDEHFSFIAGIRYDYHSYYKSMITPRLHLRYALNDDLIFRVAGGKGYRTSNILTEFASAFASSRSIEIKKTVDFGYGLEQEKAWNYGANLTYYFLWNYREATLALDFYRTDFESVLIADLDSDPQKIIFSTEKKAAYSNSFQAELNIKPLENVDLRLAYRLLDVKQRINNQNLDKLFTAKHRALINLGYTTTRENEDDWQYLFDATLQWFGPKRLPAALINADGSVRPVEYQIQEKSTDFVVLNAQATVNFSPQFSFYLGGENLLDFKQKNPIIDSGNPFGQYFDASIIWAPVSGRMVYAGFRVGM